MELLNKELLTRFEGFLRDKGESLSADHKAMLQAVKERRANMFRTLFLDEAPHPLPRHCMMRVIEDVIKTELRSRFGSKFEDGKHPRIRRRLEKQIYENHLKGIIRMQWNYFDHKRNNCPRAIYSGFQLDREENERDPDVLTAWKRVLAHRPSPNFNYATTQLKQMKGQPCQADGDFGDGGDDAADGEMDGVCQSPVDGDREETTATSGAQETSRSSIEVGDRGGCNQVPQQTTEGDAMADEPRDEVIVGASSIEGGWDEAAGSSQPDDERDQEEASESSLNGRSADTPISQQEVQVNEHAVDDNAVSTGASHPQFGCKRPSVTGMKEPRRRHADQSESESDEDVGTSRRTTGGKGPFPKPGWARHNGEHSDSDNEADGGDEPQQAHDHDQ